MYLSRSQTANLVCWHATVRAPDIQYLGRLRRTHFLKKIWILFFHLSHPSFVVIQDARQTPLPLKCGCSFDFERESTRVRVPPSIAGIAKMIPQPHQQRSSPPTCGQQSSTSLVAHEIRTTASATATWRWTTSKVVGTRVAEGNRNSGQTRMIAAVHGRSRSAPRIRGCRCTSAHRFCRAEDICRSGGGGPARTT